MPRGKYERKKKGSSAKRKWLKPALKQKNDFSKEELNVVEWINGSDSPQERQLRKSAVHGMLYSGQAAAHEGMLNVAQRIRNAAVDNSAYNPKTLTGQQKVPILSVIPPASIIAQGTAMRYGAYFAPKVDGTRGYGPYNWRDQPIEAHIYIDAAIRHLMQWFDGEDHESVTDDQGRAIDCVSHLAFALATIGILLDAKANDTLIDDRPKVRRMAASNMLKDHKLARYEK